MTPQPCRAVSHTVPPGLAVGVVGAGSMAQAHLASWQRLGAATVVFSPSGRAAQFAAGYEASVLGSLDELLSRCDVVDICTPTDTHRVLAERARDAGRHVICEKPLALTHADAAAIIAATESAGVQLHVAHVVRYFPAYARARELIADGAIGTVRRLELRRTGAAPEPAWFHNEALSGGVLMDQMIHDFDYARWVLGEAESVLARTGTAAADGPRAVRAFATVTHGSGAVAHLTGGWLARTEPFTTSLTAVGVAGELRHTNARGGLELVTAEASRTLELSDESPYDAQLAEFAAAIGGGPAPRIGPADALAAVDLTLAARRSAATGIPVACERRRHIRRPG
jgi:myo-inositol 2-dehydrogenase/D-chiro-inositol 1-dehydrogenase